MIPSTPTLRKMTGLLNLRVTICYIIFIGFHWTQSQEIRQNKISLVVQKLTRAVCHSQVNFLPSEKIPKLMSITRPVLSNVMLSRP